MAHQPLLEYIKQHVSLTEAEEALLVSKTTVRKYLKHQYIVQQGDVITYSCSPPQTENIQQHK